MDNQFNSVFDDAVEAAKDFDNIFGAQEDDELMGIVLGESGDESEDMETLDDGISPKELKDELDTGDCEKPAADSDGEFDIEDKEGGLGDLGCPKTGVEDAVQKTSPDETNLEDEIDKSEKKVDFEESVDLDKLYEETTDEDDTPADIETGDEETSCENIEDSADLSKLYEDTDGADEEPVAPAGDGVDETEPVEGIEDDDDDDDDFDDGDVEECGDAECDKCDKTDIAPSIPDGNAEVVAVDTDSDVDDDDDDDDDGLCDESAFIGHLTEETDETGATPADNLEEPKETVDGKEQEEACGESLDSLYSEDATEEAIEDEIIADVEDDSELSDAEVQELLDDDDDDLIDDVIEG